MAPCIESGHATLWHNERVVHFKKTKKHISKNEMLWSQIGSTAHSLPLFSFERMISNRISMFLHVLAVVSIVLVKINTLGSGTNRNRNGNCFTAAKKKKKFIGLFPALEPNFNAVIFLRVLSRRGCYSENASAAHARTN